ncbi:MAG TPA: family 78 glycoside hydrolase catalytic domain [Verrucomicrobiae bacterium]|jgi:alpha-L-rhamnosidase
MTLISKRLKLLVFIIILSIACSATLMAGVTIDDLRCEYQKDPLGIDTRAPRLSWILESNQRDQAQTACEVLASSSPEKLAAGQFDEWDSGKVFSAESINIVYAGKALGSGQRIWWKVRVWDAVGHASEFSKPAWFEMALLEPSDWRAQWIQLKSGEAVPDSLAFDDHPAPLFRKEFVLAKKVARARIYVSGLGYYELHLNGEKVGDHVLDPGWTTYSKRALYSTYDVTKQLKSGKNAIGIMLGNGWFNLLPLAMGGRIELRNFLTIGEPRAIVQLVVDFQDGSSRIVASDDTWHAGDGPIIRNGEYLGEVYDARREKTGWDEAGFDDSQWAPAIVAAAPKVGPLCAQTAPPIRITRILKPKKITEPKPGVFIFDFGQNFAGWARLHVHGPAGTRVRLRFGELLYPDGTLNGMTSVFGQNKSGGKDYVYDGIGKPKTAFQLDEYVLKGQGMEEFVPHFTFHGFRYVEITGFPGKPNADSLTGLRLNSDVAAAGSFKCSNPLFNQIQDMVLWTELSNLFSVQSDCPHREKLGYGGDIVASSEMAVLNFDMCRFYTKSAQDLADTARSNGGFTETSPYVGIHDEGLGGESGPVGWGTAAPLLLCQLRQYYGEQRSMAAQYATTKKWIEFLQTNAPNGILDNGIADHESLERPPTALSGTAFYYMNVRLFAQMARALGNADDAGTAESLAQKIKAAFNHEFLQPGTGRYDSGLQSSQAFALYAGLVPDDERPLALSVLVQNIAAHKDHLTTGIFGTKYMLNSLSDAGRADLAFDIVNQKTFPGWGYMIDRGATTLWEHWAFSDDTYSHNHPMFGSVSEWFYKGLAGIKPAQDAVGFDKIIIDPQPVGDLKWVKASYDSVHGRVLSEWNRKRDHLKLHVHVPIGATATVFIPAKDASFVRESGKRLNQVDGIRSLSQAENKVIVTVGSGDYYFESVI